MIKKFREFNEDVSGVTKEDIEDQFLRLKEVLDCGLEISFFDINMCQINVFVPLDKGYSMGNKKTYYSKNNPVNDDIAKELNTIKDRIKNQYDLDIIFIKYTNKLIYVWLYSNKDAESVKRIDNIKKNKNYIVSDSIGN